MEETSWRKLMQINHEIEKYRIKTGMYASIDGYSCGFFEIPYRSYVLRAFVYDGITDGWEHVSVSLKNRCPNWEEMSFIKDLFWSEDECVVQFHVPKQDHVNNHPYCLHLWRNKEKEFDRPSSCTVGVKEEILKEFTQKLMDGMSPCPPEYNKVFMDNLDGLLT